MNRADSEEVTAGSHPGGALVSVIVTCYNKAPFVARALASVEAQDHQQVEVVVVDDCSTDESASIIKAWEDTTPLQHTVIYHDTNQGFNQSLNDGLRHASGGFVCFLDADDCLLAHMTSSHLEILRADESCGMVYGDAVVEDADGVVLRSSFLDRFRGEERPEGDIFLDLLYRLNFLNSCAVTVRTSVLDEVGIFDEALPYQDYDMWLRVARHHPIRFSGTVDVIYTQSPNQMSKGLGDELHFTNLRIWNKWLDDPTVDRAVTRANAANSVLAIAGGRQFTLRSAAKSLRAARVHYRDRLLMPRAIALFSRVAMSRTGLHRKRSSVPTARES